MKDEDIEQGVREIVVNLVNKNYNAVYQGDHEKLLSLEEIQLAIEEYPGRITLPPDEAYDQMDKYIVSDHRIKIDFDLWYDDEKSDLTLCCDFRETDGKMGYTIEGIHVL